MSFDFFESEKYKANIHLLIGTTCCSPICLIALDLLRLNQFPELLNFILSFLIFIIGSLLISNSSSIIYEQDEIKNARK